jgi:hypothetical protein
VQPLFTLIVYQFLFFTTCFGLPPSSGAIHLFFAKTAALAHEYRKFVENRLYWSIITLGGWCTSSAGDEVAGFTNWFEITIRSIFLFVFISAAI